MFRNQSKFILVPENVNTQLLEVFKFSNKQNKENRLLSTLYK